MELAALEQVERKILCQAIHDALWYVANGDVLAGRQCLKVGLERATEFLDAGEPWAAELAQTYGEALFEVGQYYPRSQQGPMTLSLRL